MRIFKYKIAAFNTIMPGSAKPLHFEFIDDELFCWAYESVNDQSEPPHTRFVMIGTGNEFDPENLEYKQTVTQKVNGLTLVWHIHEII